MFRGRRLRRTEALRGLVRETRLTVDDLVYPVFVQDGENRATPVPSLPGVCRWTVDRLGEVMGRVAGAGIRAVLLFGIPAAKDATGRAAWDEDGVVCRALRATRRDFPDLLLIADVCLCEYTDHGHCGVVADGAVANDATLPLLARAAVAYARAGADVVAPSAMMDGQVAALRAALDAAGFVDTAILSYAAKFASAFYGPFRDAAGSAPAFGDRRAYQMDPANAREALREVAADLAEGADFIIAKPALAYGDVIRDIAAAYRVPVVAYNVSGEYAMVKAAAERGWIDERRVVLEALLGLRRAGASAIITYHALDVARWLSPKA